MASDLGLLFRPILLVFEQAEVVLSGARVGIGGFVYDSKGASIKLYRRLRILFSRMESGSRP